MPVHTTELIILRLATYGLEPTPTQMQIWTRRDKTGGVYWVGHSLQESGTVWTICRRISLVAWRPRCELNLSHKYSFFDQFAGQFDLHFMCRRRYRRQSEQVRSNSHRRQCRRDATRPFRHVASDGVNWIRDDSRLPPKNMKTKHVPNVWKQVSLPLEHRRLINISADCRRRLSPTHSIHIARRDETRQFCRIGSGGVWTGHNPTNPNRDGRKG